MYADCHIHMVLDGVYYKDAIAAHRDGPREDLIHLRLETYRSLGFTYLRDGGDRWGVGQRAGRWQVHTASPTGLPSSPSTSGATMAASLAGGLIPWRNTALWSRRSAKAAGTL